MDKRPKGPSRNNVRQKWSKDGKGGGNLDRSAASGVHIKGNKWMCFCKCKFFQWNTNHTSGFYAAWVKEKATFILTSTHEFRIKMGTSEEAPVEATPATDADLLRSGMSSMTGAGRFASLNASKTNAVLEHYKTNLQDSDLSALMYDFQTAWGLN